VARTIKAYEKSKRDMAFFEERVMADGMAKSLAAVKEAEITCFHKNILADGEPRHLYYCAG